MQLGMIGLGRMGGNIVRRLMKRGHKPSSMTRIPKAVAALAAEGAVGAAALEEFVAKLEKPRTAWVMLPAGKITEATVETLSKLMQADDVIIDGGNSFWQDDVRRGKALSERGQHYVDVGTSGGVWGIERGYCMMIGGEKKVVDRLDPILPRWRPASATSRAPAGARAAIPRIEQGYIHAGPVGAGHFVKMIHNGIEYGLMQAYAEGFDILKNANIEALPPEHRFDLDIADIAEVWRRGSVIPSWLLDLTASALAENHTLDSYSGFVEDSGEGRWTVNAAIDEAVPAEVLTAALFARFRSRKDHTFAEKILPRCAPVLAATGNRRSRRPEAHGSQFIPHRKSPTLRLRHLWRHRRPDTSPGDPCPLQSRGQRSAARQILCRRCRPQGHDQRRPARRSDERPAQVCDTPGR